MTATTPHRSRNVPAAGRLPGIIRANGWFSIVSGVGLFGGAGVLDQWFGLPAWVIAVAGASLIPYGLLLRRSANVDPFDRRVAWLATGGDVAWVVGAIVLLAIPGTMSTGGKWTLALVSVAVLDFAVLQIRQLGRR